MDQSFEKVRSKHSGLLNNVYAHNTEGIPIHISEAARGRKGYFCIGCKAEMQACHPKYISPYFRHDVKDPSKRTSCTYSDFSVRSKIAKEALVETKTIKLPVVQKFPANPDDGPPKKLIEAKEVVADQVLTERYFYEDESGNIEWGDKKEETNLEFLFKADVVFLDKDNHPFLIAQLVDKHKKNIGQYVKLKRLGIDTIQISIPRESPEDIRSIFKKTDKTKWLYNYVQENTTYIRVPSADSEAIQPIDEFQRELFDENFLCRQAEIRNLIRSIAKCLGSKPYRDIENGIRSEIDRIDKLSIERRKQLEVSEGKIDSEVSDSFGRRREADALRRATLRRKEAQLERVRTKIERRYAKKREDLDREETETTKRVRDKLRDAGHTGLTFDERKERIGKETIAADQSIEGRRTSIQRTQQLREQLPEKYRKIEEATRQQFAAVEAEEIATIERIERETARLPEDHRRTVENHEQQSEQNLIRVREEFERRRIDSIETIKGRSTEGGSELSKRIKDSFFNWGLLRDFQEEINLNRRNRKAWDSFRKGTWKDWRGHESILKSDG